MKISTHNHPAHRADCHTGTRRGARPGAVTFAILLLWLLPVLEAEADSLRCGRKVVRSGDAQSTVLSVCGEPQRKDTSQEAIWIGSGQKTVRVNRWYYKSSGRKLERVVWLYQGKVIAVETGGR
jgi:hypothetical protein